MTSKQLRLIAIALLALAAILALLAWQVARQAGRPAPVVQASPVPSHAVVVTTRTLEAGKPIAADALRVAMLPIDPAGAHRRAEALVGRVPRVDVGANVPVLDSHLSAGLAAQVPDGERAVAVAVDEVIGVGHRVRPGDFVDVFVVLRRDSMEVADSQARLLLSRLRVLAYGGAAIDEAAHGNGVDGAGAARRDGARTAVLTVPLAQVGTLAMAQQAGRLVLALRNPDEALSPAQGAEQAATRVALRGLAGTAAHTVTQTVSPAPALAATRPPVRNVAAAAPQPGIEVIRAGRRELE
ncbi:pilus assembly protein CpaB [Cupriavidus gilardii J11]|uniref:Pilus assembly protein CpaB n=1 Tax=Cupriavidus gilardii J11 TaxID=936133 RepID=A0A562B9D4_9BURK|nr:Flp pilus assembly protein CpaB [Cupriavidus gilardii]TWG81805.1 pilus assembly protein CpaB [Cupriavidus gilardii J11]